MSTNSGFDAERTVRPLHTGLLIALPSPRRSDVQEHLSAVDSLLTEVVDDLTELWDSLPAGAGLLADSDLPQFIEALIRCGGKRLRPVMAYLGWLAGGGSARDAGRREVVRVSAALELLHLFALIHDDVMDESTSRRGRPTVHVQAERLHRQGGGSGNGRRFGESIAVLVGDLAHAEAGNLVAELPAPMRRIWRVLVAELVAGQRHDLVGCATGRRDLDYARTVARMKSGRYTVERPLELGAAAAGARESAKAALAVYGKAVGEAFALRDDILGIWGDPDRTGKPAGDDLTSGKPTVILAIADQRLRGTARNALRLVGTNRFTPADLAALQEELVDSGIAGAVEQMIARDVEIALTALNDGALDRAGVEHLTRMAHEIAWRDR